MLAQRMREDRWQNAQVALVGKVECRVPDPVSVLNVGGFWEVGNRHMRAARAALTEAQQGHVMAYLLRPDEYTEHTDEDGRRFWKPRPPAMRDDEASAFRALWRHLHRLGGLTRTAPRPRPQPAAPAAPATE
jgi:hypothetical protein